MWIFRNFKLFKLFYFSFHGKILKFDIVQSHGLRDTKKGSSAWSGVLNFEITFFLTLISILLGYS